MDGDEVVGLSVLEKIWFGVCESWGSVGFGGE